MIDVRLSKWMSAERESVSGSACVHSSGWFGLCAVTRHVDNLNNRERYTQPCMTILYPLTLSDTLSQCSPSVHYCYFEMHPQWAEWESSQWDVCHLCASQWGQKRIQWDVLHRDGCRWVQSCVRSIWTEMHSVSGCIYACICAGYEQQKTNNQSSVDAVLFDCTHMPISISHMHAHTCTILPYILTHTLTHVRCQCRQRQACRQCGWMRADMCRWVRWDKERESDVWR